MKAIIEEELAEGRTIGLMCFDKAHFGINHLYVSGTLARQKLSSLPKHRVCDIRAVLDVLYEVGGQSACTPLVGGGVSDGHRLNPNAQPFHPRVSVQGERVGHVDRTPPVTNEQTGVMVTTRHGEYHPPLSERRPQVPMHHRCIYSLLAIVQQCPVPLVQKCGTRTILLVPTELLCGLPSNRMGQIGLKDIS
jgi:hypothetical protein